MLALNTVDHVIVHHSSRRYDLPAFVRFRHRLRGWEDTGYHYLIGDGRFSEDGKLYTGRLEEHQGAHALGYNDRSLGVCLIGNLDIDHPTERQIESLLRFLERYRTAKRIPLERILGHRELPDVIKSCPGSNVSMDRLRESLRTGRNYRDTRGIL